MARQGTLPGDRLGLRRVLAKQPRRAERGVSSHPIAKIPSVGVSITRGRGARGSYLGRSRPCFRYFRTVLQSSPGAAGIRDLSLGSQGAVAQDERANLPTPGESGIRIATSRRSARTSTYWRLAVGATCCAIVDLAPRARARKCAARGPRPGGGGPRQARLGGACSARRSFRERSSACSKWREIGAAQTPPGTRAAPRRSLDSALRDGEPQRAENAVSAT